MSAFQNKSGGPRLFLPLLFVIQFFSWTGMFILWVFTLPLLASLPDTGNAQAIRWVGYCFALYVTLAAIIALALPWFSVRMGACRTHGIALLAGAASLAMMSRVQTHEGLLFCFAGLAVGWASISSIPYALVSDRVSDGRYARAMGIFNFSSVIPQVVVALSLGTLVGSILPNMAIASAGAAMALAGILTLGLSLTYRG